MKIWKKYEDKVENIYEETDKIKKKKKRKKDQTKIWINVSKQHIRLFTRIVQEPCVEYKKIFYESDYAWYKVLSTKKDNIMKKYKN